MYMYMYIHVYNHVHVDVPRDYSVVYSAHAHVNVLVHLRGTVFANVFLASVFWL